MLLSPGSVSALRVPEAEPDPHKGGSETETAYKTKAYSVALTVGKCRQSKKREYFTSTLLEQPTGTVPTYTW